MATLEETVLRNVSFVDYYEKYIVPLNYVDKTVDGRTVTEQRYIGGFNHSNMAVCPFHNDHDPSLGLTNSKKYKGVKIGHCFGCGSFVDVIRAHQRLINKRRINIGISNGQYITYEGAANLLAKDYGIDISNVQEEEKLDLDNIDIQRQLELIESMGRYTIRDFENDLISYRLGDYNARNKAILLNRSIVSLTKAKL